MKPLASGSNTFFPFFPNDHLNDLTLRGCPAAAKGIWMDMICLMAQGKPFGYLRIEPGATRAPAPLDAPPDAPPPGTPLGTPSRGARATPHGAATAIPSPPTNPPRTLAESGSLETELHILIGQPEDLTRWAIAHLESRGVFSRNDKGVIYSRRMVRWAQAHEDRSKRAREAYERYKRTRAAGGENARAGGTPLGTPSGVAPRGPVGVPNGRAAATPSRPPISRSTPPTTKTPPDPPRKRVGPNKAAIAEQVRRHRA